MPLSSVLFTKPSLSCSCFSSWPRSQKVPILNKLLKALNKFVHSSFRKPAMGRMPCYWERRFAWVSQIWRRSRLVCSLTALCSGPGPAPRWHMTPARLVPAAAVPEVRRAAEARARDTSQLSNSESTIKGTWQLLYDAPDPDWRAEKSIDMRKKMAVCALRCSGGTHRALSSSSARGCDQRWRSKLGMISRLTS